MAALGIVAALVLALAPPAGLAPAAALAGAVTLVALAFWATGVIPDKLTSAGYLLAAMTLSLAPPGVVLSGFASSAFWLIFDGLMLGAAVHRSGLAARLAQAIAHRLGGSYLGLSSGIVCAGLVLAFLIPSSTGRVVLLIPIVLALADGFGLAPGSRGRSGLVLAMVFATTLPGFAILPASVPTAILIGGSEPQYGIVPSYGQYLLLHFPVLGLLKCTVIVVLTQLMFAEAPRRDSGDTEPSPLSAAEWRTGIIVLAALALWLSDRWHGLSPAWISMAAAAACLAPPGSLIGPPQLRHDINYGVLLLLAGLLGAANVVAYSGLGDYLGRLLLEALALQPGDDARSFFSLVGVSGLVALIGTLPSVPAVMTALAGDIAGATGLPVETVLMMQVPAYSTPLLPYQVVPVLIAARLGSVSIGIATRFCLLLGAITVALLIPLDYLWWRFLGVL
ncbi:MAG: SLC13 family permease [Alphaproteobacteria bacterium]|nr:SLC13 family permease [Alphaproteobacteria bacterium]